MMKLTDPNSFLFIIIFFLFAFFGPKFWLGIEILNFHVGPYHLPLCYTTVSDRLNLLSVSPLLYCHVNLNKRWSFNHPPSDQTLVLHEPISSHISHKFISCEGITVHDYMYGELSLRSLLWDESPSIKTSSCNRTFYYVRLHVLNHTSYEKKIN